MTLRRGILGFVVAFAAACSGDTGPAGPMGDPGTEGMNGSDGAPGPITDPPALASLSPRWGSANTQVTITGTNFSTTPADNHVFFDGMPATVLAATATQLVVTADFPVENPTQVVVSVEVANQVSNGLFFELVASGTGRALDEVQLPSAPTGVAVIGNDIYIASGLGGTARTGGLFKLSNGVVTQLVQGTLVKVQVGAGLVDVMDVPLAITAASGNLYYTTSFGVVRKYTVATGVVSDVLTLPNAGNTPFPQRTGITVDALGTIYVVDRSFPGVIGVTSGGQLLTFQNALLNDVYGIATDGTDLFVTNPTTSRVIKIATPTVTPAYSIVATEGGGGDLSGVTLVGTNVIASDETGKLWSTAKSASAGSAAAFGDVTGYVNEATGLAAAGTDLILAQPGGGVVRRKPSASPDATIIAAGVRFSVAAGELAGKWYVSTVGPNAFNGGFSTNQRDGAIVEIAPDGTSRVLATTYASLGLVVNTSASVTVSDAVEKRIFELSVVDGTQMDILVAGDFTGAPLGIARDATALYWVETGAGRTIGKRAGGTKTAGYVTGLDADAAVVAIAGGQLVTAGLFDAAPLQKAPVATGGPATVLTSPVAFQNGSLVTAPDATLFGMRVGAGQLITIDPATGSIATVGASLPPDEPVRPVLAGAFTLRVDNTATVMDYLGGRMYAIAP